MEDNSSNGKRFRGTDNESQGSFKRMKMGSLQSFEVQRCPNGKAKGISQSAIDAKLGRGGSKVCGSKPSESRSPSDSPIYGRRKWSNEQEICLMNAILDTRKPNGEINWTSFYLLARKQLQVEVSNSKLYEKMKNMKKTFQSIVKERKEGKLGIQTVQQHTMFSLWAKLWGALESKNPNLEEKEIESSRPNETGSEISNSAENSSSPREHTLNPDSVKNLENRENRAVNSIFAEGSEFTKSSAINAVNFDYDVKLNISGNRNIMENKDRQSLQEEIRGEETNPNFSASPKHMENKTKTSLGEEIEREDTQLLEKSIHQEIDKEIAGVEAPLLDKSPQEEIHVGNAGEIDHDVDFSEPQHIRFRGIESRIEALIENSIKDFETRLVAGIQNSVGNSLESRIEALTENSIKRMETRLEAAMQNSVRRIVTAAVTAAAVFSIWICLMRMETS